MLATPIDAWYAWIGTGLLAVATLAVVVGLPTTPPPDAGAAANAIDGVAARELATARTVRTDATAVRLSAHGIGLRNAAGVGRAALAFGPITPATGDRRLARLARGAEPAALFDRAIDLASAAAAARAATPVWRPTDGEVHVRRVRWEGYDVVIVAA